MISGNNIQMQGEMVFGGLREGQESREGDWICVQCNNLNFSFRKRCNRCKVQSREENEEQIRRVYEYYEEYCRNMGQVESQLPQTLTSKAHSTLNITNSSLAQQHSHFTSPTFSDSTPSSNLPSVSPYIKRYKSPKQYSYTKTQISQGWSSDEQSNQSKQQYLSQYCWQNILVDDEQQSLSQEFQEQEGLNRRQNVGEGEDFYEFQIYKLVQNIVL